MPSRPLVAFDLDGVLFSSEPFLGAAYREAIQLVNRQRPGSFSRVPETREILDHVGWPVPIILARLFPAVGEEAVQLLHVATLDVICTRVAAGEGTLYSDVAETLRSLERQGYALAIASNGRGPYIEAVLTTYGIVDCFLPRVTADMVGDKGAILRTYSERHGIGPTGMVMIGDRTSDVEAAQAIGCGFIGCDYGHGYRQEIEAAGPVVSRFRDLPAAIGQALPDPLP